MNYRLLQRFSSLVASILLLSRTIGLLGHSLDQQRMLCAQSKSQQRLEQENDAEKEREQSSDFCYGKTYKFPPYEMHYTQQNLV
jgi:hypothetical protein